MNIMKSFFSHQGLLGITFNFVICFSLPKLTRIVINDLSLIAHLCQINISVSLSFLSLGSLFDSIDNWNNVLYFQFLLLSLLTMFEVYEI